MDHELDFRTAAVQAAAGTELESTTTGDVVAPIHLATTHEMAHPGNPEHGYKYARMGNPTRDALERRLARLEGADDAVAFGSGTAATATTCLSLLDRGDRLVAFESIYGGTRLLFEELLADQMGVDVEYVDATDPDAVRRATTDDTAMLWVESPTNPLLRLCDLSAMAEIADDTDAVLAVDNTFATPYFQRPLDLGADVVVHSTTKYLNGHSDSLGGAVLTDDDTIAEGVRHLQEYTLGNPLSPVDSYFVHRGTKTLPLRMDRHEANAVAVAEFLADHPAVETVYYPGLDAHPQHDLASRQMSGYGGVVSFEVDGDAAETKAFVEALDLFTVAVSLGGVESLVEHPATMSASYLSPAERERAGISDSLVRAPIGVEDADDLIDDLRGALANLT